MAVLGRGRSAEHRFAEFLSPGSADVGVFLGFPLCCLPSILQKIVGAEAWVPKSPASNTDFAGAFLCANGFVPQFPSLQNKA